MEAPPSAAPLSAEVRALLTAAQTYMAPADSPEVRAVAERIGAVLAAPAAEPVPCAGCAALTKERDAARLECDGHRAARDRAHVERDTAQAEVERLRGEVATKQEIIDHVVRRLGSTPSLAHRVDAHAALVRDLAALREQSGHLWGPADVLALIERARALVGIDPDPRAAGPGGGEVLPGPVKLPSSGTIRTPSGGVPFKAGDTIHIKAEGGQFVAHVQSPDVRLSAHCAVGQHGGCHGVIDAGSGSEQPCPCNCHKVGVAPLALDHNAGWRP